MHEAVRKTLSDANLTGGHGTTPYNFRCPICGDSKKNKHKKRGYVVFDKGPWVYTCHNECGKMSFLNFLKDYHPSVHRELMFMALIKRGPRKAKEPVKTAAEKAYKTNPEYAFKPGELIEIDESYHPLAQTARAYCQSRKIPRKIYSRWFVCVKDTKYHDRDNGGNIIYNDKGVPKGNEYANRLIIPYYRFGGKFVQFDARALDDNAFLRYRNLEGAERELYMYEWLDVSKPFFLLEGSVDSTFIKNSIAFGGTQHLMKFLEKYPEIAKNAHNGTVIWDNDDAGYDEMPKTIKLGFNWFDWETIKPLPQHRHNGDGSERIIKDVNDMVLFTDAITTDSEGFVVYDSLIKYIKKPDGGILAAMRYGNRDKIRKERNKKRFDEMKARRNNENKQSWYLG
jgi:hypothetical protein